MFKHILLPIDGSDASNRAIDKGVQLAKALGAEVTVMTAIEQYPAGLMGTVYRTQDNPAYQAARDAGAHWLEQATAQVRKQGMEPKQITMQDRSVAQGILDAAQASGADLIVMGSHGAGALERLLIGSQTQRVLAQTGIPVLVLR